MRLLHREGLVVGAWLGLCCSLITRVVNLADLGKRIAIIIVFSINEERSGLS